MAEQLCRFLRVLEYIGTREQLTLARENRQVKGTFKTPAIAIYEGIVGDADQPVIGQLKLWCCQQIVAADEGKLYPDNDSMRDGYIEAIHDVLQLTLPENSYKALLGDKA